MLSVLFPFLRWFPLSRETLRADLVAGITVALILVPQSMAYAQLAGLPVVYGLYASLLPVVVGSMWGSSNQLHTATLVKFVTHRGSTGEKNFRPAPWLARRPSRSSSKRASRTESSENFVLALVPGEIRRFQDGA